MNTDRLFNEILTYEDRHDYDELGMVISNHADIVYKVNAAITVKEWDGLIKDMMRWRSRKNSNTEPIEEAAKDPK